ncbi:MAG: c-type cytochrome [Gammaproteobacteria bacterium]|nr:c-type cytochrome [Gammaproteobacteria bacterium]MDH5801387.1 c-type cytochrome [Gammaproteobacteria bacterium]
MNMSKFLLPGLVIVGFVATMAQPAAEMDTKEKFLRPDLKVPVDNKLNAERINLGKMLFFDPRLSGSNWISCATCHNPALGWSDGLPKARGNKQKELARATPTLVNVAYNRMQMWDGRFRTLEQQALGPIESPDEMNQNLDELVTELKAIKAYEQLFFEAYPGQGITKNTIAKALSSFQRTIVATKAPFDRWVVGDEDAISQEAKSGFALFTGKANCAKCHMGFNFVDDGFHNIGLKSNQDEGRFGVRPVKISMGAFKTPTLRDIAKTAPYMHNGIYNTLEEVVDHYDRGGDAKGNLSPNIEPLNLSDKEKADLVAFLKTLSGESMQVQLPYLPNHYSAQSEF